MTQAPMEKIAGWNSFKLESDIVRAYITQKAGMLAPVYFDKNSDSPIQPYSISPWCGREELDADTPPILKVLRGDFFCSAFGENGDAYEGRNLPVHGETANNDWTLTGYKETDKGLRLDMQMELKEQGGSCAGHTALVHGENVIYQRHDCRGMDRPFNPGHHATLQFPDREGAGRLAFSPFKHAHTLIHPAEDPSAKGYSILKPDQEITDLTRVSRIDGITTDLTQYPARRGYEDIAIICADPSLELAWSSVTFDKGYVWYSLRDPKHFPCTLLWMSNGGRHYAPWNGRHINVLGVEDMTGFFHLGLAPSVRDNILNAQGIQTSMEIEKDAVAKLPYIQGVCRVPEGFDRVAKIEAISDSEILLRSESGKEQRAKCRADFIRTGILPGILEV
ncbi:MAG: hypothetical protein ACLFQ6_00135 [Candidatus Sumerlaeia bacterium]